MDDLTVNSNNEISMNSLDFFKFLREENSELRHAEFLAKLEDELDVDQNDKTVLLFGYKKVDTYELDEYDLIQLGSRLSKPIRKQTVELIKRLKAEIDNKPKVPQTYAEALLEAGRIEKERLVLENKLIEKTEQLKIAEPKINMYNQFFDSNGLMSFLEYAKTVYDVTKMGRNTLMHDLRLRGILLKTSNLPQQRYIDNGSFKVFYNSRNKPSAKLTRKGVELLNSIYLDNIVDERYNLFNLLDIDSDKL